MEGETAGERDLIDEQVRYYRARAGEYDEWFLREGRYDRGEEHRREWSAELEETEAALRAAGPRGDVLELACGTGLWTARLAPLCRHLTAVDASPECLALNRRRLGDTAVEYVEADLFGWRPTRSYDFVFFAFWLSHVPPARFDDFWSLVASALRPEGTVFFVDSLLTAESTAKDHGPIDASGTVTRRLNDGRTFRVVKVFYEPAALEERLRGLGWRGQARPTGRFFFYGCFRRGADAPPQSFRL